MHAFFITMARAYMNNEEIRACMGISRLVVNYYYVTAGSLKV
jgi:hypothetical protein